MARNTYLRRLAFTVATTAASVLGTIGAVHAADLVVTGPGGQTGKQWQKIVYDPFTADTGHTVTVVPLGGDETLAKAIAEISNPSLDVFQFPGGQEDEAVKRNVALNVGDLAGTGVKPDFVGPGGQWVGAFATLNGIIYNTKHIPKPPTSILDLLKPEYAGKVGIPGMTSAKGTSLLVTLAKASGGDENNAEPGLKAIGQLLKGGAKVFTKASQLQSMLAQDEVWIAYYDANNAITAQEYNLPIAFAAPQEGMSGSLTTLAVAKNTPKGDAARALLKYMLKPAVQQALAEQMMVLPSIESVSMPKKVLDKINITDANLKNMVHIDANAIAKNRANWIQEFNRLAAQ